MLEETPHTPTSRSTDAIPHLEAVPPGLALRSLSLVLPTIRHVVSQIEPYTHWWSEQNQRAVEHDGPLLVVIGDSTALGIGASRPDRGYVRHVVEALSRRDSAHWRVVNLAQSGARLSDGLERQLPLARRLVSAQLGLVCLGTNDVVWGADTGGTRSRAHQLIGSLAHPAVVCQVAGRSTRARLVNRAIRTAAVEHNLAAIDPWSEPGPGPAQRLASDRFHPNDLGYALMASAIARALNAPIDSVDENPPPWDPDQFG